MYYQDFYSRIQQLYQYVEAQQQRIEQLEAMVEDLDEELKTLKQQNSQNRIDKIEYKFDQLKIERLEGTLNIGLTPNGGMEPNSIEDFSVSQNKVDVPDPFEENPQIYENIQNKIYEYLDSDCHNTMKSIEQHYQYPLDDQYRDFIIDDVRKQINNRIRFYLKDLKDVNVRENHEAALLELENKIVDKVKSDIDRTIEEYIKHLPKKGD